MLKIIYKFFLKRKSLFTIYTQQIKAAHQSSNGNNSLFLNNYYLNKQTKNLNLEQNPKSTTKILENKLFEIYIKKKEKKMLEK